MTTTFGKLLVGTLFRVGSLPAQFRKMSYTMARTMTGPDAGQYVSMLYTAPVVELEEATP